MKSSTVGGSDDLARHRYMPIVLPLSLLLVGLIVALSTSRSVFSQHRVEWGSSHHEIAASRFSSQPVDTTFRNTTVLPQRNTHNTTTAALQKQRRYYQRLLRGKQTNQTPKKPPAPGTARDFHSDLVYAQATVPYNISDDAKEIAKLQNNQERRALFVHVGKAGGTTILRLTPRKNAQCTAKIQPIGDMAKCNINSDPKTGWQETTFSRMVYHEMHIMNSRLNGVDWDEITTLLYVLRDPIDRLVSAFNYIHYKAIKPPGQKRGVISPFASDKSYAKDQFYIECFPTFTDVFNTIHDAAESVRKFLKQGKSLEDMELSFCQKLGITIFPAQASPKWMMHVNIHIQRNHEFYDNEVAKLPNFNNTPKEVFVIRTEHLWQDVKDLDKQLGGPGYLAFEGAVNSNDRVEAKPRDERQNVQDFCCLVWRELVSYTDTLNRAENLNKQGKDEAMQHVFETCSIEKPDQWNDPSAAAKKQDIQFSWKLWYDKSCAPLEFFQNFTMLTYEKTEWR